MGSERTQLGIGRWRCDAMLVRTWQETEMRPAGPGGQMMPFPVERQAMFRCGEEYDERSSADPVTPKCKCGMFSIGECHDCGQPFCGQDARVYSIPLVERSDVKRPKESMFLCTACRDARAETEQAELQIVVGQARARQAQAEEQRRTRITNAYPVLVERLFDAGFGKQQFVGVVRRRRGLGTPHYGKYKRNVMLWRPLPDVLPVKISEREMYVTRDGRLEPLMENVRFGRPASRLDPKANFMAAFGSSGYKGTHEHGYSKLIEDPSLPGPTFHMVNEVHHRAVWDLAKKHGLITDDL